MLYTSDGVKRIDEYVSGACDLADKDSLKIEALAHGDGLDVSKYRRQKYRDTVFSDFYAQSKEEARQELGIYITSNDYSKDTAPSFFANVHFSFSGAFSGIEIIERPMAFILIAVREDLSCTTTIRRYLENSVPAVLRGGHWESRPYILNGYALEWDYRNHPIKGAGKPLHKWELNFDKVYA